VANLNKGAGETCRSRTGKRFHEQRKKRISRAAEYFEAQSELVKSAEISRDVSLHWLERPDRIRGAAHEQPDWWTVLTPTGVQTGMASTPRPVDRSAARLFRRSSIAHGESAKSSGAEYGRTSKRKILIERAQQLLASEESISRHDLKDLQQSEKASGLVPRCRRRQLWRVPAALAMRYFKSGNRSSVITAQGGATNPAALLCEELEQIAACPGRSYSRKRKRSFPISACFEAIGRVSQGRGA